MTIVFPPSPNTNDTFSPGPNLPTWVWDGSKWVAPVPDVAVGRDPGPPDTSIQFNDNGEFAGSPYLTWDGSALKLASHISLILTDDLVSALPAASSNYSGARATVSDAQSRFGVVTGGGSNIIPIHCDGTNWRSDIGDAPPAAIPGIENAPFLPLVGGVLSGALTLSGNPTAPLHAAPRQYVDTFLKLAGGALTNVTGAAGGGDGISIHNSGTGTKPSIYLTGTGIGLDAVGNNATRPRIYLQGDSATNSVLEVWRWTPDTTRRFHLNADGSTAINYSGATTAFDITNNGTGDSFNIREGGNPRVQVRSNGAMILFRPDSSTALTINQSGNTGIGLNIDVTGTNSRGIYVHNGAQHLFSITTVTSGGWTGYTTARGIWFDDVNDTANTGLGLYVKRTGGGAGIYVSNSGYGAGYGDAGIYISTAATAGVGYSSGLAVNVSSGRGIVCQSYSPSATGIDCVGGESVKWGVFRITSQHPTWTGAPFVLYSDGSMGFSIDPSTPVSNVIDIDNQSTNGNSLRIGSGVNNHLVIRRNGELEMTYGSTNVGNALAINHYPSTTAVMITLPGAGVGALGIDINATTAPSSRMLRLRNGATVHLQVRSDGTIELSAQAIASLKTALGI